MKLDIVAGSKNDEFYTPLYAIKPILKYIDKNNVVWCPFDTNDSLFVRAFKEKGNIVFNSHILYGDDFFNTEIPECDIIVSNPPYTKKGDVLERLFGIGKPFAMLVGCVGLFESKKRFSMFRDNNFEIMYFDKRVAYFKDYMDKKPSINPPFSSVYICKGILPSTIVFEELDKTA